MIVMCSKCHRVKIAASTVWATAQPEICWAVPVDPDPAQPGTISHQYCPECAIALEKTIGESAGQGQEKT